MATVGVHDGRLTAQVGCLGLTVGSCLSFSLHSSYKPSELSQWPSHDDSTIRHCH